MSAPRSTWTNPFAFILASAASAIGLGNLWRFPYLAAQYGGGMFILVYLLLVVTLGFTLMVTEIAIGRKTQQSQLTAYGRLDRRFGFLGPLATIIPLLILPYYCVIGGWVLKYTATYFRMAFGGADALADPAAFFDGFVGAPFAPFTYAMLFILLSAGIIILGVRRGIEKSNIVMMPLLFLAATGICIYICTLPGAGDGIRYYLVPNLDCVRGPDGAFSVALLGKTVLGAMGQMFYSLSLAAGVLITYGSYMRQDTSIDRAVRHIEFFDTFIALVAGLMIIPVVHIFASQTGTPIKEAMDAGPGLMFITLPKVFACFGGAGAWFGLAFFVLVTFAALTSAISLYEACVASLCDPLRLNRLPATCLLFFLIAFLATFSALGYGPWRHITLLGMQMLNFFDFATNSVMMPIVAALTCVFAGWLIRPKAIVDEVQLGGRPFAAAALYRAMVRYVAPLLIAGILVSEVCRALGLGGWAI